MKAKVKATGEIIEVTEAKNGYYIDNDSNPYKAEDIEIIEDAKQPAMFAEMLANMLNPFGSKEMEERYRSEFWVNKHIDVFFKTAEMLKSFNLNKEDLLSSTLVFAKVIIKDLIELNKTLKESAK